MQGTALHLFGRFQDPFMSSEDPSGSSEGPVSNLEDSFSSFRGPSRAQRGPHVLRGQGHALRGALVARGHLRYYQGPLGSTFSSEGASGPFMRSRGPSAPKEGPPIQGPSQIGLPPPPLENTFRRHCFSKRRLVSRSCIFRGVCYFE